MVYESDFSRRQFLNSCAQNGMFYSSREYKPKGQLSTVRTTPSTSSRSEKTARLLASLSITKPTSPSPQFESQSRRPHFDLDHPYTCSEAEGTKAIEGTSCYEPYTSRGSSIPTLSTHSTSCCACCKNCNGSESRRFGYVEIPIHHPIGGGSGVNLRTPDGSVSSYIKSRRPILELDHAHAPHDSLPLKPKPMYSVRNIPVRSLEELRETVAIRRNYVKERQQLSDDNNGILVLPYLEKRDNSISPQPDGSFVSYPSDKVDEGQGHLRFSGGSYRQLLDDKPLTQ